MRLWNYLYVTIINSYVTIAKKLSISYGAELEIRPETVLPELRFEQRKYTKEKN
jgi:hypothetical protein